MKARILPDQGPAIEASWKAEGAANTVVPVLFESRLPARGHTKLKRGNMLVLRQDVLMVQEIKSCV